MPHPPISPQLLQKYLRNECSESERKQVEDWYASLPGQTDYLDSLPAAEQQRLQTETFRRIQDDLNPDQRLPTRSFAWGWAAGLAASVVLVVGLAVAYRYALRPQTGPSAPVVATALPDDPARTVRFTNGQPRLAKHLLPDGSTVWMQAGASIAYPRHFDKDQRLVQFSGEGFFDVKKNPARPFLIRSGAMQIKVLGTSFNVKAPVRQAVFRISVVTGRVQVSAPDRQQHEQRVILMPRQQAVFETGSRRLVASPIPEQTRREFYEPISIQFNETPLDQAVQQLQRRFKVQISLVNPRLASCRVSADFEQQSLPLILEMLCAALDATYTIAGSTVRLDGPACE